MEKFYAGFLNYNHKILLRKKEGIYKFQILLFYNILYKILSKLFK